MVGKYHIKPIFWFALILIPGVFLQVQAGHPLKTDDAYTVGAKNYQIEITPEFLYGQRLRSHVFPFTLTIGGLKNLDIVWGISYSCQNNRRLSGDKTNFWSDQALEFKWRLFEVGEATFSLKPGILFPGKLDTKLTWPETTLYGIVSYEKKEFFFHSNFGIHLQKGQTIQSGLFHFSMAGEYYFRENMNVVLNLITEGEHWKNLGEFPLELIIGTQLFKKENLIFDCGIGAIVWNEPKAQTIYTGVTYQF